jgi:uncharacterized protein (DUF697 family)
MSNFCDNCGAQLRDSAKFCGQCGNRATGPSQPPTPTGTTGANPPAQTVRPSTPVADTQPPPMQEVVGDQPPPPQYWESYDYPSVDPKSPRDWIEKSEKGPQGATPPTAQPIPKFRASDASRPLPPLSFGGAQQPAGAREKARDIARSFAISAAGIVLVPLPFSDLVFLMPIQTAMVLSIGKAYNVKDPPEKTLAHISAACGASVFGQITTLFVANLIPIIGKLISAPFVYGWTYGLGEVAIRYFEAQGELQGDELKAVFKKVSKDATRAFRKNEIKSVEDSFSHLQDHLSPEEYEKLRKRFS